jgi:hypothetical protein
VAVPTDAATGEGGRSERGSDVDAQRPELELAKQEIFDRASPEDQDRYLELMRHDPIAGMAYLDALGLLQQGQTRS